MAALYQGVFKTLDGRLMLVDLLSSCGVLTGSHVPGDPYETAWHEGRRSVGLELMERLRIGPEGLLELSQARVRRQHAPEKIDE